MENINGKSQAGFRWMLLCATVCLPVTVSPCFAQDNRSAQEMQRLWEMQRIGDAPQRPFTCDSLDPKVCFDIYRRRMEQTPERIPDNTIWPGGEFGQATAPFGKAPLPSFKLPSQKELQSGTRIK
jgi:hypothetical protein